MRGRKSVILEGILRLDHYFPESVITASHFSTKLLRSRNSEYFGSSCRWSCSASACAWLQLPYIVKYITYRIRNTPPAANTKTSVEYFRGTVFMISCKV